MEEKANITSGHYSLLDPYTGKAVLAFARGRPLQGTKRLERNRP